METRAKAQSSAASEAPSGVVPTMTVATASERAAARVARGRTRGGARVAGARRGENMKIQGKWVLTSVTIRCLT